MFYLHDSKNDILSVFALIAITICNSPVYLLILFIVCPSEWKTGTLKCLIGILWTVRGRWGSADCYNKVQGITDLRSVLVKNVDYHLIELIWR